MQKISKYFEVFLNLLTFEEKLLQAAPGHELVHQEPVLVLVAVTDQFDQVRMPQLPQEYDFGLNRGKIHTVSFVPVSRMYSM